MKKRIIILAFSAITAMSTFAQKVNPQEFLEKYKELVERVEGIDSNNTDLEKLDSLKTIYKDLTKEVKKVKDHMSSNELEEYYILKGRYQKKIAVIKTKRGASAVKGWVKGMVNK